jgi:hypothetical protein
MLALGEASEALYPGMFDGGLGADSPVTAEAAAAEYAARFVGNEVSAAAVVPSDEAAAAVSLGLIVGQLPRGQAALPTAEEPPITPLDDETVQAHMLRVLGLAGPEAPPSIGLRTRVVEHPTARLALVAVAYPAPPVGSRDRACMELANVVLGGDGGRLKTDATLIRYSVASGTLLLGEGADSRLIAYGATPMPWRVEALKTQLARAVASMASDKPLGPELEAARAKLLEPRSNLADTPELRAYELARCISAGGDVAAVASDPLGALRGVTEQELRAVAARLDARTAAVAVVLPRADYVGEAGGLGARP